MTNAIITPDLDAVECEILVAAPPARVFEALTDSAQLRRWWGAEGECRATLWEMDARPGGKWRFEASDPTGKIVVNGVSEFKAGGEITEFDPPRRLAYTWKANWHDRPGQLTLVRWELAASPGGTRVKVTHSGLADLAVARKDYSGGWPGVLNYLKNFLEKPTGSLAMATAAVTPDQDAVLAEIFIAAPPERVFDAITDPSQTPQWWGQNGMYRITEWHCDLRPGGKWASQGVGADGKPFGVKGEYLEIDRPRLLVHTWNPSYAGGLKTTVRWELEPHSVHRLQQSAPQKVGTGTLVRLRHYGFAGDAQAAANHSEGWKRVLGWMQAFLESGETIDTRQPAAAAG